MEYCRNRYQYIFMWKKIGLILRDLKQKGLAGLRDITVANMLNLKCHVHAGEMFCIIFKDLNDMICAQLRPNQNSNSSKKTI